MEDPEDISWELAGDNPQLPQPEPIPEPDE